MSSILTQRFHPLLRQGEGMCSFHGDHQEGILKEVGGWVEKERRQLGTAEIKEWAHQSQKQTDWMPKS